MTFVVGVLQRVRKGGFRLVTTELQLVCQLVDSKHVDNRAVKVSTSRDIIHPK